MAVFIGSTNWSVAWRGVGTTVSPMVVNASFLVFLLWNERMSFACPMIFSGAGIGSGLSTGFILGDFTHFTTSNPMNVQSDFNGFGSIMFTLAGPSGASGVVALNVWGVDHAPNPILCTGALVGGGAAVGWQPGRFQVLTDIHLKAPGAPRLEAAMANDGLSYSGDTGGLVAVFDDSPVSMNAISSAASDYLQSNTDPVYQNAVA